MVVLAITLGPTLNVKAAVNTGDVQVAVWHGLVTSLVIVNVYEEPLKLAVTTMVKVIPT